jgi:hypothetical protein
MMAQPVPGTYVTVVDSGINNIWKLHWGPVTGSQLIGCPGDAIVSCMGLLED